MEQPRRTRRKTQNPHNVHRRAGCCGTILLLAFLLTAIPLLRPQLRSESPPENPYAPSDFTTVDGYVTCTAVPTRRGVDVSEYQTQVDWEAVHSAGFDFAFIRIGYRGNSTGAIYEDDLARTHLADAKAAGLDVGVYFYAQAVSPEEAAEEAQWCLDFLNGESLTLPVVYDWEYVGGESRTAHMDRATLTKCARTFCESMETGGYPSMIYFNPHISRDLLNLNQLQDYPWWLAQYKDQMDYRFKVDFWQYTETGSVPGIKGNVDINLMFLH